MSVLNPPRQRKNSQQKHSEVSLENSDQLDEQLSACIDMLEKILEIPPVLNKLQTKLIKYPSDDKRINKLRHLLDESIVLQQDSEKAIQKQISQLINKINKNEFIKNNLFGDQMLVTFIIDTTLNAQGLELNSKNVFLLNGLRPKIAKIKSTKIGKEIINQILDRYV